MQNERKLKLSFDMSDIFFISKSDLSKYELFTPDVHDCVILIIEGKEGIIGTHRFREDKSSDLTKFIKEKLPFSGSINVNIAGGNFACKFIKPEKDNLDVRTRETNSVLFAEDMYKECISEKFNYENLSEIVKKINHENLKTYDHLRKNYPDENYDKPIELEIKNNSGIRNIFHVLNAIKKTGKKIEGFDFKKMQFNPCDVYINFDQNGKPILNSKKREEYDSKLIETFKPIPNEMKAEITNRKSNECDSSDYDNEVEEFVNKKVLNKKELEEASCKLI